MWESRVPFLVWEDPLEKEMATHSSTVLKNRLIQQVVLRASFVALSGRNLPAMQQTWVRFLAWEDPLEKEMATHSSILAWRIPSTEEPGRLQSMES